MKEQGIKIPEILHRRLKMKCARERTTIKQVVTEAVANLLKPQTRGRDNGEN